MDCKNHTSSKNNNNQAGASNVNVNVIKWSSFDIDDNENPVGAFNITFEKFSSKQLRTICSRLSVKGVKNVKKQDMIDCLVQGYCNWKGYQDLERRKPPRKQVQCPFWLVNVLFSDEFAEDFSTLGNVAS